MDAVTVTVLSGLIFFAAALYSSVGHAGGSGYLAAMALFGLAPVTMKPVALALNIPVAAIATWKFYRAGCFSWKLFWPFAAGSIPFAFLGGRLSLPGTIYKAIVGVVLLYASVRLYLTTRSKVQVTINSMPLPLAITAGSVIGLLSGLTGVGGGIFLSPLLLFAAWATPREASGVAALFILVNSIAGLLGNTLSVTSIPPAIVVWALLAAIGGWIGAEYGSRRLGNLSIRRLLSAVLVIAGVKMLLP